MNPPPESTMAVAPSSWADQRRFFRSWLSDPMRVASVAPSSHALAKLMTREIDLSHAPVLELGPGTGVFTRALLDRGLAEQHLTLIEYGADFAAPLRLQFPRARVVEADAARLPRLGLFASQSLGAAISGLPLLSLPPRKVMTILAGVFASLRPGSCFYQFTYGPRCPVPRAILERLGLETQRIGGTWRNLPPASVYRFSRSLQYAPVEATQ